jgi:phage terminase small subunit
MSELAGLQIPTTLGRWGRIAWKEALATLVPKTNLAQIDLRLLEMACCDYETWKIAILVIKAREHESAGSGEYVTTPNGYRQMSPERITANKAALDYRMKITLFGATPIARLKTTGTAQGDLFDWCGPEEAEDDEVVAPPDETDPYNGVGPITH